MNNRSCLILGSSSDVGRALAHQFSEKGFDILLASRRFDDEQKALKAELESKSTGNITHLVFEGTDYASHTAWVDAISECPDVVISVFGYLGSQEKASVDFEDAHQIIEANFVGHVSLLNAFADRMEKLGRGTIIGFSSVAGERGRESNYIYGAAKAGFTTYLSGLRNRLFHSNLHVITVLPGYIDTKMIKGIATPSFLTASVQEVASAVWRAYKKRKNKVYVLSAWRYIMFLIKSIPESIFKRFHL